MPKPVIFLAAPHRGTVTPGANLSYIEATKGKSYDLYGNLPQPYSSSILTACFNELWTRALNARKGGVTHFAMLHDDVEAGPRWLDTLYRELVLSGADIIHAVVAIKTPEGVTSTGVYNPKDESLRRLTISEVLKAPKTFTAEQAGYPGVIFPNTGCWLCRIDVPWAERICDGMGFTIRDRIVRHHDGVFHTKVYSEDWLFGLWAYRNGLKVVGTTAVKTSHQGMACYPNYEQWGTCKTEPAKELAFDPPAFG